MVPNTFGVIPVEVFPYGDDDDDTHSARRPAEHSGYNSNPQDPRTYMYCDIPKAAPTWGSRPQKLTESDLI